MEVGNKGRRGNLCQGAGPAPPSRQPYRTGRTQDALPHRNVPPRDPRAPQAGAAHSRETLLEDPLPLLPRTSAPAVQAPGSPPGYPTGTQSAVRPLGTLAVLQDQVLPV